MKSATRRIRILHIVGGMRRGGIETWLMHILRHVDCDRFEMDFLVHTAQPCPYDDEVRALGGNIIPCLHPARPRRYARNFRRALAAHGRYDIVHSHVHHYSGYILRLARHAGVPVRIAHSHVDVMPEDVAPSLLRRTYLATSKRWICCHATIGLACSGVAADALFGKAWRSDARLSLLYYGIDPVPFRAHANGSVRAELGLPADAFVIGHVGRFEEQKNHRFMLEIVREVVKTEPRTRLLLIGAGSLQPTIKRRTAELGLASNVIFAGLRSDVPRVLRGAVDAFVMPSLCEGLGIAAVEAQAAGVPSFLADTIPAEADVVPPLVKRLSLSQPANVWSRALLAARSRPHPVSPAEALAALERSPFNICKAVAELQQLYVSASTASISR
jgi:glycosyltransferase involved in cell wall biosynthesis